MINNVVVFANKIWIFFLFEQYVKVAVDAAVAGCIALAGYGHRHAIGYARRYIDADNLLALNDTTAGADVALVFDDFARAATCAADCLCAHLSEDGIFYSSYHARATTRRTSVCARASALCTRTVASLTSTRFLHFEFFLDAFRHFAECQLYLNPQAAALGDTLTATRTRRAAETSKASSKSTEYVAEIGEDVLDVHIEAATAARARYARMSKLVVTLTFLVVAEHLVCLCSLLKLLLGNLVARVSVGVVLHGEFAVRLLYFVL